ncbi:MAG: hypothetical protein AAF726_00330 [Planctomycetota bacterium]
MKYTQRLDHARLAEVLHERGLANLDSIRELLQLSQDGGMAFCEAIVTSNLVSDWDLSKVVCEVFQLPFLPVDLVQPNPKALEGINREYFAKHQLVPIDVFGQVLTVAMPGLVSAEVLAEAATAADKILLPLVGTVESNRRWVNDHLMATEPEPERAGGWGSLFDEADAEVQAGLTPDGVEDADAGLGILDDPTLDAPLEAVEESLDVDLGALEDIPDEAYPAPPAGGSSLSPLPPMPDFEADSREAS